MVQQPSKQEDAFSYSLPITSSHPHTHYNLLFLYKLPWILWVNEERFPLWVCIQRATFTLHRTFEPGELVLSEDTARLMLAIGTVLLDRSFQEIEREFEFGSEGGRRASPPIFLSINAKERTLAGEKYLMVENGGIRVYYRRMDGAYRIHRILIEAQLRVESSHKELPYHLLQGLVRSHAGRKEIAKRGFVSKVGDIVAAAIMAEIGDHISG